MAFATLGGCGRSSPLGSTSPEQALGQATCKVQSSSTRPLLVEWPAADRAMLEAAAESGIVAARYNGCELEVLSRCTLGGEYEYRGLTHKRDAVRIRDEDSLWTELPIGAAQLEAALSREGQINVDMTVVGRLEADMESLSSSNTAACSEATHLVSGMTVGAFAMYTGSAIEGSASASAGGLGGGLSSSRSRSVLRRDGDFAACDVPAGEGIPPTQCGALLRVELMPLDANGRPTTDARESRADEVQRLERAADRWHAGRTAAIATAAVAVAGSIAGIAVVGTRSVQITDAEFDLGSEERTATDDGPLTSSAERARAQENVERLEAEIASHKEDRRIATGVAIGLGVGAVAMAGVAYMAKGRENRLRARARSQDVSLAPTFGPGFGGLSLSGRF